MRILVLSSLILLAACGQRAPALPEPPAAEEQMPDAALEPQALPQQPGAFGVMTAMSQTAMSIPGLGAVRVEPTLIQYLEPPAEADAPSAATVAVQTQFMHVYDPGVLIAAGGQSFEAAAAGSNLARAEVRKITGAAPAQLCGQTPATYVAILTGAPLTVLTFVYFAGPDAPGPDSQNSAVCATYSYAVD